MMKLYYSPISLNARRAWAPLLHLGLKDQVEMVLVDFSKGEHMAPAYLAINPNHKVPTLVDGDYTLWESFAIALYLAEKTPGQTLWPDTPRGRADVMRWVSWHMNHFGPVVGTFNTEHVVKPFLFKTAADPAALAKAEKDFATFAPVLNHHLEQRSWLAGDRPTLADFYVAAALSYEPASKIPLDPYPHIQAWNRRMLELPAWAETAPKLG
jgi:glutathione S-transferase